MRSAPFSREEARRAIAEAQCWSDALRALGYRPAGQNIRTLQRYARKWGISTEHFDPREVRRRSNRRRRAPLEEILIEGSSYSRGSLKERLYEEGLKDRRCELCGTGERWLGRPIALVLDHINGVGTDNRLDNLRIVCPNCAAMLDTHCGRNLPRTRLCSRCREHFAPRTLRQRYCSISCASSESQNGVARPMTRRVERPPHAQLAAEIERLGYRAVGRRYGVSDNAVRKWVRFYEKAP